MLILLRDDPMNVAGEIGGSGIRMARPLSREDLGTQVLAPKFKAIAAFESSGGTGPRDHATLVDVIEEERPGPDSRARALE